MKIGYSYIRFSAKHQARGNSLERQMEATRAYCERNGITLDTSKTLQDLGVSAHAGLHRLEDNKDKYALAAFMEMVREGKIEKDSYLIIENLDRLTREHVRPALMFFMGILESGVNIVTLTPEKTYRQERGDTDTFEIMLALVELSRSNSESEMKSERIGKAWKKRKAKATLEKTPLTKTCPQWLRVVGNRYEPIPERVKVVQNLFADYIDGKGIWTLAKELNAANVQCFRGGKTWQPSSVARIIANRSVIGEYTPQTFKNKKVISKGEPVSNFYPVVIDEDTFYAAQAAHEKRKSGQGGKDRTKGNNLFTSLVIDGDDGTSWATHGSYNPAKKTSFQSRITNVEGKAKGAATKGIPYRHFERAVLANVMEIAPADLLPKKKSAEADRLAELNTKVQGIQGRLLELQEALATGGAIKSVLPVMKRLEEEKEEAIKEAEAIKRSLASPTVESLTDAQSLIGLVANDKGTIRQRLRAKIANVINKMTVWYEAAESKFGERKLFVKMELADKNYTRQLVIIYTPGRRGKEETSIVKGWVNDFDITEQTYYNLDFSKGETYDDFNLPEGEYVVPILPKRKA